MSKPIKFSQRHERLVEELRKVLKRAKVGDRLDSMAAIATQYGVSINTVRMAMVILRDEGWVKPVHGNGCFVSRPRTVPTGRSVALLSEYNLLLAPDGAKFYSRLMHELRLVLQARGISSRLYIGRVEAEGLSAADLTCSDFLEDLELGRFCGVASLATLPGSWTHAVRMKELPIVGMGGRNNNFTGVVDPDCVGAIQSTIRQFSSNGRSRPAYIGWDKESMVVFRASLKKAGLIPDPRWVRGGFAPLDPGAGWSEFREIWASSKKKPDCVIFGDDALFLDAIPAIQACGVQVPSELEVVVLSNKGTELPRPFAYTRLDCDPCELAEAMGGLLVKLIRGEELVSTVLTVPYRVPLAKENDENEVMNEVVKEAL